MSAHPYHMSAGKTVGYQIRSWNQDRLHRPVTCVVTEAPSNRGSTLDLMIYSHCFKILNSFWTRIPTFLLHTVSSQLWIWSWKSGDGNSCFLQKEKGERNFLDVTHLETPLLAGWAWRRLALIAEDWWQCWVSDRTFHNTSGSLRLSKR